MAIGASMSRGILSLEKLRGRVRAMFSEGEDTGTTAHSSRELELRRVELFAMQLRDRGISMFEVDAFHTRVSNEVRRLRGLTVPLLPPLTPEQRANASSHTKAKALPESYIDLIRLSADEPHLAKQYLENAVRQVPCCHMGWRLLALVLLGQEISKLPNNLNERRIEDDLIPLNYYGKVVQLLPKDVGTWWIIATQLHRKEEEYHGDLKLRSHIFVKVGDKNYTARDCFARVLELEPNVPVYWLHLGRSMLRSHHPSAPEEYVVNIAFEGGPTMTDVTARYCYEAYLRIHPKAATCFKPWMEVARVMLDEEDVVADVDDAFTSIELDNGATKLTRPGVLARMVSVNPFNNVMWARLYTLLADEPASYRLPVSGLCIPDITPIDGGTSELSAHHCLVRQLVLRDLEDGPQSGLWLTIYDHLHQRGALQTALQDVLLLPLQQPIDIHTNPHYSTDMLSSSGGTYITDRYCASMLQKAALNTRSPTRYDGQIQFHTWLIVASLLAEDGTSAVPVFMDTLQTQAEDGALEGISFKEAFLNAFGLYLQWSCEVRRRLLRLLREQSDTMLRIWPAAPAVFDLIRSELKCPTSCASCCILAATCLKISPNSPPDAYTSYVAANINTCAEVEPSTWYELGRLLRPGDTVTTPSPSSTANDGKGKVYTKCDYFKLAIESPTRWNRAEGWLWLGKALQSGEVFDIHGKPHTREDCFQQATLWFDDKPNDQLMMHLTRRVRAPVTHHPHCLRLEVGDDVSEPNEEEDGDSSMTTATTVDEDEDNGRLTQNNNPLPTTDAEVVQRDVMPIGIDGAGLNVDPLGVQEGRDDTYATDKVATPITTNVNNNDNATSIDLGSPSTPPLEEEDTSITTGLPVVVEATMEHDISSTTSPTTTTQLLLVYYCGICGGGNDDAVFLPHSPSINVVVASEDEGVVSEDVDISNSIITTPPLNSLLIVDARVVRHTWAGTMIVQSGLTALKAFSGSGCGFSI